MKAFIICVISIFLFNCSAEKTVTITKKMAFYVQADGAGDKKEEAVYKIETIKEKIGLNTEKLVLKTPSRTYIEKIQGVEQLNNLSWLFCGNGIKDVSFLNEMKNLEVLVVDSPDSFFMDFSFLKNLSELKIFLINDYIMNNSILDLENNKKIEFISLNNIFMAGKKYYELEIRNVPESLRFFDISHCLLVIINKKLIDSFKKDTIILVSNNPRFTKFEVDYSYLHDKHNVKIGFSKDILPQEYSLNHIYKHFGLEE